MTSDLEPALGRWNFRSVWISDVHLGTRHAQVSALLGFLRESECRYLYVVGDLIDGWELKAKWFWRDEYNVLIQKLLRKSRKQTRIVYITGNHDEFVEHFIGLRFGNVTMARQVVHTGADGKRYLVIHGHQGDGLTHFNRLLDRVGSRLYQKLLDLNLYLNRVRRTLGFGYWSLASYLKFKAKQAVKYASDYEQAIAQMARKQRADGVICGHTHRPEIKMIGDVKYLNCGDWVENCTALVEDFDGAMRLIHFHENLVLHSRRGAGAHDTSNGGEGDARSGGSPDRGRDRGPGTPAATAGVLHVGHASVRGCTADTGVRFQEQSLS